MFRAILIGAIIGMAYFLSQSVMDGEAAFVVSMVPLSAAFAVFALWN